MTQEKIGGTDQPQNLKATDSQNTFAPPVFEQKVEQEQKEQKKTVVPPPPVVETPSVIPPEQKLVPTVVQENRVTHHPEQSSYTTNDRQNNKTSNLWIWGLIVGVFVLIAAVVILEFMPSKKAIPATAISKNESPSQPPIVSQPQMPNTSAPSASVTESEVSIGYVKTKTGSTLRMRKEPSENAEILSNVPDGSSVIILGYDDHTSIVNGESGRWCKIKFNDKTGWAWGTFIIRKQ